MSDKKISQLPAVSTPLAGTEELPAVQSAATKKVTLAQVQAAPVAAGTANGVLFLNASKVPSSGSTLVFDSANGRLGVGTASPTVRFDVTGQLNIGSSVANGPTAKIGGFNGSGDILYLGIASRTISDNNSNAIRVDGTGGAENIFNVKLGGNVGIGVASPSQKLDVAGSIRTTENVVFGTAGRGLTFSGGQIWRTGAGSPEGAVTAPVGSLFTRTDGGAGTTLYVKESGAGNTGWVAK